jgi:acetylornithine deacetylase/succinyl-diaminopimelate desuccinylase-like protein
MSNGHFDASPIELLSSLVSISSHSGEESAIQRFIVDWFGREGVSAVIEPADDDHFNAIVEVKGASGGPTLWLGGHCDTVSPAPGWATTLCTDGGWKSSLWTGCDGYEGRSCRCDARGC